MAVYIYLYVCTCICWLDVEICLSLLSCVYFSFFFKLIVFLKTHSYPHFTAKKAERDLKACSAVGY